MLTRDIFFLNEKMLTRVGQTELIKEIKIEKLS
jgi:hypothetical protein